MARAPISTRHSVWERVRAGGIALNAWTYLTDPAIVEIAALAGYDSITFDLEHFPYDLGLVRQMIVTAHGAGISPFVRVQSADSPAILPVLEIGAHGLLVPHANEESAREMVQKMRYAPLGERGALSFSRAAAYGEIPWEEHVKRANEEVVLIVVVEDADAIENVERIAAIEGVDFITIGAHDLAESMGVRDASDPRVREAIAGAAATIRRVGKARLALSHGNHAFPISMAEAREWGIEYMTVLPSLERMLLLDVREHLARLRREEAEAGQPEAARAAMK